MSGMVYVCAQAFMPRPAALLEITFLVMIEGTGYTVRFKCFLWLRETICRAQDRGRSCGRRVLPCMAASCACMRFRILAEDVQGCDRRSLGVGRTYSCTNNVLYGLRDVAPCFTILDSLHLKCQKSACAGVEPNVTSHPAFHSASPGLC